MPYGVNSYKDVVDPGHLFADQTQQPGVGGPAAAGHQLQRDPTTGLWYDPATGTSYVDQAGRQVVTDPNVAQQVATNFSRSQQFVNQLAGVQAQQGHLATSLSDVIAGRAPSLAGMQAQQGMNAIAAQQLSQAAGVGGASAPLAQLLAMRNTGAAQVDANNAGAIGRVAEANSARGQLSQLLAGMGATDAELGNDFAGQAAAGQASQQGLNASIDSQNAAKNQKAGAGIASAISSFYGAKRG